MEGKKNITKISRLSFIQAVQICCIIILVIVGIGQILAGVSLKGHFFFLLAFTLVSILSERKKILLWFVSVAVATHIIEVIGVLTGVIFGSYEYTAALGFVIGGVPIVIGLQWALIVLGLSNIVYPYVPNRLYRAFLVGCLAVCFDIVLEVAAIKMGFWEWGIGRVPLLNYIAWFVIAFCSTLFLKEKGNFVVTYAVIILFLLLSFFAVVF